MATVPSADRRATLKMTRTADGPALVAGVSGDISREEFQHLANAAYATITKLTGCQCMSGRYKFVVEDSFLADVMHVNLKTGAMGD
jgi:hypothetical protein